MNKEQLKINSSTIDDFNANIKKIIKKVALKRQQLVDPKKEEILAVYDIIKKFIIEKKRKIYGGYALNMLLKNKNIRDAIYDEEIDTPDIDFYSPDPLKDLKELCDLIYNAKFKYILGEEAQHAESYKIHVNFLTYCDITYMPANIFHKTKFMKIDDMNVIHPHFMMIDYFRAFTDPITSFRLLEKMFPRYMNLEKSYPLPVIKKPLYLNDFDNKKIRSVMNMFFDKLSKMDNIIFTGFYIYNYYLHISKFKNYNFVNIPYFEVYSTQYINDGLDLIDLINDNKLENITYEEHYPFFQFLDYFTIFYYNDGKDKIPILYLYSNNKRCIPFKKVNCIKFIDNNVIEESHHIKLGCFDHNILHALITLVQLRVNNDEEFNDHIYTFISNIVAFKDYYNKNNKTNSYDENNIFEQFVTECHGKMMDPQRKQRLEISKRIKEKKPIKYRYNPEENKAMSTFVFVNSSGNPINNVKNLKLKQEYRNIIDDDNEILDKQESDMPSESTDKETQSEDI